MRWVSQGSRERGSSTPEEWWRAITGLIVVALIVWFVLAVLSGVQSGLDPSTHNVDDNYNVP